MKFIVNRISVDPSVSLTPLNNSRYELNDIKRAWVDCEIKNDDSSYKVDLIIEGISRGRLLTIIAKECPLDTMKIMNRLNTEFIRIFSKKSLQPYKWSPEKTVCALQVTENEFLGALHKTRELGGFSINP